MGAAALAKSLPSWQQQPGATQAEASLLPDGRPGRAPPGPEMTHTASESDDRAITLPRLAGRAVATELNSPMQLPTPLTTRHRPLSQ